MFILSLAKPGRDRNSLNIRGVRTHRSRATHMYISSIFNYSPALVNLLISSVKLFALSTNKTLNKKVSKELRKKRKENAHSPLNYASVRTFVHFFSY